MCGHGLLHENLSGNKGYIPTSYWSGRFQRFPQQYRLLALFLVAHHSYIVKLRCGRYNTLWITVPPC